VSGLDPASLAGTRRTRPSPAPLAAPPGRVVAPDVLRGVSIVLVVVYHAYPRLIPGGGVVGVVMFFTLSGYLITRSLLSEHRRSGHVDLLRYARRRVARLWPAVLTVLVGIALVTLALDPLGDRDGLGRALLTGGALVVDLPVNIGSGTVFHLWTASVEAQFYLVWPLVLVPAMRRGRTRQAMLLAAGAVVVACLVAMAAVAPDLDVAYRFPTSWGLAFVVGGLLATMPPRPAGGRLGATGIAAFAAAAVTLVALTAVPVRGHWWTYLLVGPAVAVSTAVLLVLGSTWRSTHVVTRALTQVGIVAFGAYVWNYPVVLWLREWSPTWSGPVSLAITAVLAPASWALVERPALNRWARS
jgi:peptidoglycan/LPS O-acetylase OafA/YrhL